MLPGKYRSKQMQTVMYPSRLATDMHRLISARRKDPSVEPATQRCFSRPTAKSKIPIVAGSAAPETLSAATAAAAAAARSAAADASLRQMAWVRVALALHKRGARSRGEEKIGEETTKAKERQKRQKS